MHSQIYNRSCLQCTQPFSTIYSDKKYCSLRCRDRLGQARRSRREWDLVPAGVLRSIQSWKAMRTRCLNPNHVKYPKYGGAGIKISPRWLGDDGFKNFLDDVGERPEGKTLDRYPNQNGNYEPGNVRWATATEQANNRRPRVRKSLESTAPEESTSDFSPTFVVPPADNTRPTLRAVI